MKKLYLILVSGILIAQGTYAEAVTIENNSDRSGALYLHGLNQGSLLMMPGQSPLNVKLSDLKAADWVEWLVTGFDFKGCYMKQIKEIKEGGTISLEGKGGNSNNYHCKVVEGEDKGK